MGIKHLLIHAILAKNSPNGLKNISPDETVSAIITHLVLESIEWPQINPYCDVLVFLTLLSQLFQCNVKRPLRGKKIKGSHYPVIYDKIFLGN